jgi:GTP-binding protein LepA
VYAPDTSAALGSGFRVGFLGLLHMEVVQQRLEREYKLELVMTAPSVAYRFTTIRGEQLIVDGPDKFPSDPSQILKIEEPFADVEILAPYEAAGALMELCQEARGEFGDMQPAAEGRVLLRYAVPLAEVITDFFDALKSRTKGYASMDYKPSEATPFREAKLVKLDILINGEPATPLSMIVHKDSAQSVGKRLAARLKDLIPRQQFKVPIQAVVGAKVIASEHITAMRKDVTAKCYGGDQSRKKKLLMKQAEGKKRMKEIGRVSVPQSAFMACLSLRTTNESGAP